MKVDIAKEKFINIYYLSEGEGNIINMSIIQSFNNCFKLEKIASQHIPHALIAINTDEVEVKQTA